MAPPDLPCASKCSAVLLGHGADSLCICQYGTNWKFGFAGGAPVNGSTKDVICTDACMQKADFAYGSGESGENSLYIALQKTLCVVAHAGVAIYDLRKERRQQCWG